MGWTPILNKHWAEGAFFREYFSGGEFFAEDIDGKEEELYNIGAAVWKWQSWHIAGYGEVPKWLKGLASNTSRSVTRREGSNPSFSAF